MEPTTTLAVTNRYVEAVSANDFAAVAGMFADDIAGKPSTTAPGTTGGAEPTSQ
ncbi:hypothetical protein [Streptomyces sp. SA15]|uniref:hypothetical protein n=1 Tax=Streptomyces sp. SA15 TaxID=934019 RepID=UPI0015CA9BD9|nr:hypothetical protein [Streptomyces sp. SA15]